MNIICRSGLAILNIPPASFTIFEISAYEETDDKKDFVDDDTVSFSRKLAPLTMPKSVLH